ncbi:MAG: PDZ domain-containing protein [Candidatus Omnitrophota bacterium]
MKFIKTIAKAVITAFFCVLLAETFYGDVVITKDREKIKGVIVEEYKDRVVISTLDGEKEILRRDIANINFDLEEQNLVSMGDLYQDRAMYQESYYYYRQALEVNPNCKSAKEGLDYSGSMLQQFERKMKLNHIKRMNEENAWRMGVKTPEENIEEEFRRGLGFSVEPYKANFRVTDVQRLSPAYEAGLIEGDIIVALWGRMVGYSRPEEFVSRIMSSDVIEVRLTIERGLEIELEDTSGNLTSLMGMNIAYSETEGFEVMSVAEGGRAARAGIIAGDIFTEIEGNSTRYMPLSDMERVFMEKMGSSVNVTIKRDISIWKRFSQR